MCVLCSVPLFRDHLKPLLFFEGETSGSKTTTFFGWHWPLQSLLGKEGNEDGDVRWVVWETAIGHPKDAHIYNHFVAGNRIFILSLFCSASPAFNLITPTFCHVGVSHWCTPFGHQELCTRSILAPSLTGGALRWRVSDPSHSLAQSVELLTRSILSQF